MTDNPETSKTETSQFKKAFEAMSAFKKLVQDELEFRAVAVDYLPALNKAYDEAINAGDTVYATEVKKLIDIINLGGLEIVRQNKG